MRFFSWGPTKNALFRGLFPRPTKNLSFFVGPLWADEKDQFFVGPLLADEKVQFYVKKIITYLEIFNKSHKIQKKILES